MNLYELSSDYHSLLRRYNDATDDAEQECILKDLESLDDEFTTKVENCAKMIRTFQGNQLPIQSEIDRLKILLQREKKSEERLKEWVKQNLLIARPNDPRVETDLFKVRVQKNGGKPSTEVTIPAKTLPAGFKVKIPASFEPDIDALIERWKAREKWVETWLREHPAADVMISKEFGCIVHLPLPEGITYEEVFELVVSHEQGATKKVPNYVELFPYDVMLPRGVNISVGTHLRIQ